MLTDVLVRLSMTCAARCEIASRFVSFREPIGLRTCIAPSVNRMIVYVRVYCLSVHCVLCSTRVCACVFDVCVLIYMSDYDECKLMCV